MKVNLIVLLSLLGAIAILSCKKDTSALLPHPPDHEVLESGWRNFMNGRYSEAVSEFNRLIHRGALLTEAYTGLGWSYAFMNCLEESVVKYKAALNTQPSSRLLSDIYAGLSFVYDALDSYQRCLSATDSIDSNWVFAYKPALDFNDIILLRAISFYGLGDFSGSLSEVQRLDPSFIADISTIDGRAALADKIEELRGRT